MNCYYTTLIAKLHCNIYSIVVKYRRTFCLQAYFFGVSGFHKCFSISPLLDHFTTSNEVFFLFIMYFYHLVVPSLDSRNNSTAPHIPILLVLIRIWKKHISMWYPCFSFFSGQLTSFIYSAQYHIPICVSFSCSLKAFNLRLLSVAACLVSPLLDHFHHNHWRIIPI